MFHSRYIGSLQVANGEIPFRALTRERTLSSMCGCVGGLMCARGIALNMDLIHLSEQMHQRVNHFRITQK